MYVLCYVGFETHVASTGRVLMQLFAVPAPRWRVLGESVRGGVRHALPRPDLAARSSPSHVVDIFALT